MNNALNDSFLLIARKSLLLRIRPCCSRTGRPPRQPAAGRGVATAATSYFRIIFGRKLLIVHNSYCHVCDQYGLRKGLQLLTEVQKKKKFKKIINTRLTYTFPIPRDAMQCEYVAILRSHVMLLCRIAPMADQLKLEGPILEISEPNMYGL